MLKKEFLFSVAEKGVTFRDTLDATRFARLGESPDGVGTFDGFRATKGAAWFEDNTGNVEFKGDIGNVIRQRDGAGLPIPGTKKDILGAFTGLLNMRRDTIEYPALSGLFYPTPDTPLASDVDDFGIFS